MLRLRGAVAPMAVVVAAVAAAAMLLPAVVPPWGALRSVLVRLPVRLRAALLSPRSSSAIAAAT